MGIYAPLGIATSLGPSVIKLSDKKVRALKPQAKDYRVNDDNGLSCLVATNGKKYWRFRYQWLGREKMLSMGEYPHTSLELARKKTLDARALLAQNIDPSIDRVEKAAEAKIADANTFEAVGKTWFDKQKMADSTRVRDGRILGYLYKELGARPIGTVDAAILLAALEKIEARGTHETAHRARTLAGKVLRYAITKKLAIRDWSVDLKDSLSPQTVTHRAAVTNPKQLGKLMLSIYNYDGQPATVAALKLLAMTFVRPGELRTAPWSEFDLDNALWEIPAERMKMKEPHIVPLPAQAVAILKDLKPITGHQQLVFPSLRPGRPLSENTMTLALRNMGFDGDTHTAHGFRATARTILDEVLNYRTDFIEHQLAHTVRDANGKAYNRTAFLPQRREMLQAWADYLDKLRSEAK